MSAIIGGRRLSRALGSLVPPVLALVAALVVAGFVVGLTVHSWVEPFQAYRALLEGAFGSWYEIQETLTDAIPLIFAGLAVALCFRAGLFNLGAEGQMYAGAILSAFLGYSLGWPGFVLLPVCIIASGVAGAVWALIPAAAKTLRGTHEIVTTFMLNYVALFLMHYLLANAGSPGPMAGSVFGGNASPPVNVSLPVIFPTALAPGAQLNLSFVIALTACAAVWFVLSRTTFGYRVRAVGMNPEASQVAGTNLRRTIILTMLISGCLAGLAGSAYVFGVGGQLQDTWDGFATGFDAIAVALLGRNSPAGVIIAAVLFGAMDQGSIALQLQGLDANLVVILQGLVIFFVACEAAFGPLGRLLRVSIRDDPSPRLTPT